jgi:hypothetical protein
VERALVADKRLYFPGFDEYSNLGQDLAMMRPGFACEQRE